jgi:predicted CopG family antitoxin
MADDTAATATTDWVTEMVVKMAAATNGVLQVEIGGVMVNAELGKGIIQFLVTNKDFLLRIGQESFSDFLYLLKEKREEDAFLLLSSKMNADDITAQIEAEAGALTQANTDYDTFVADLKAFGNTVVLPILTKVIIGLL